MLIMEKKQKRFLVINKAFCRIFRTKVVCVQFEDNIFASWIMPSYTIAELWKLENEVFMWDLLCLPIQNDVNNEGEGVGGGPDLLVSV